MGIFVIIAATLTKAEFFISIYADNYMFWYTREASVAMYVANLPCIWPLLREALPVLKSWTPGAATSSVYRRRGTSGAFTTQGRTRNTQKTNPGLSRASMDEFQAIVEPRRPTEAKTTTSVHTREKGNYMNHTRSMNRTSGSDSSIDDLPIHGIRAETTIEMNVITPDYLTSTCKDDDRDDISNSSTVAFARDVERGEPEKR